MNIHTISDVRSFFHLLVVELELGGGFHPDTPIRDYVNNETGKATFTFEEADRLQGVLDKCFQVCQHGNYDIYQQIADPAFNPPPIEKIKGHKLRWNGFWGKWQVQCPAGTLAEFDKVADAFDHIERNQ